MHPDRHSLYFTQEHAILEAIVKVIRNSPYVRGMVFLDEKTWHVFCAFSWLSFPSFERFVSSAFFPVRFSCVLQV